MSGRLRALSLMLGASLLILTAVLRDASHRRAIRRQEPQHRALVDTIGVADLALSSSARWLRHPSQAEPGAATSDLPSSLDVDPAGAILGPPHAILRAGAPE